MHFGGIPKNRRKTLVTETTSRHPDEDSIDVAETHTQLKKSANRPLEVARDAETFRELSNGVINAPLRIDGRMRWHESAY
jgi:hypothetical protein